MKRLLILAILLMPAIAFAEVPTVNLPVPLREPNWTAADGTGSCVHSTVVMLARWQLEDQLADHWRSTYSGGEYAGPEWNPRSNLARKFDKEGVVYAYTTAPDEAFLEWSIATRRGCGITCMGGSHMIYLVELTPTEAAIIDPNQTERVIWVDRNRLISEWKASNSWAVTIVGSPCPPLPIRSFE